MNEGINYVVCIQHSNKTGGMTYANTESDQRATLDRYQRMYGGSDTQVGYGSFEGPTPPKVGLCTYPENPYGLNDMSLSKTLKVKYTGSTNTNLPF